MNVVTVAQLRQNPTEALADVEAGESYRITRHGTVIARLEPPEKPAQTLDKPKRTGRPPVEAYPEHTLRTAGSLEELLESLKGDW